MQGQLKRKRLCAFARVCMSDAQPRGAARHVAGVAWMPEHPDHREGLR